MISIIGSGRVGATTAAMFMLRELDNRINLVDIVEGLPQGEALDLNHTAAILGLDVSVTGSNSYDVIKGSDIVVITAGLPRKPGMTREELAAKNAEIVSAAAENVKKYAPNAIVIVTTNPLDVMVAVLFNKLKFPRNRVIGFSGVLDSRRMAYYASRYIGVSPSAITPLVLGQHGENMYPVPELSFVYGKSLKSMLNDAQYVDVVKNTINAGADITNLRKFSSNWGPAGGLTVMVDAIKNDRKTALEASVLLDGEYGYHGVFAEVPIILGKDGVEKVVEVDLNSEQKEKLAKSVDAIRNNLKQVPESYLR
ncbi:MAG: malate dehydrogenase [Thermoplasmatales archaeon]